MKRHTFSNGFLFILVVARLAAINSLPTEIAEASISTENAADEILDNQEKDGNSTEITTTTTTTSDNNTMTTPPADLEMAGSEQKEQTFVGTVGAIQAPDNTAEASTFDPTVYGGLLTPEAFQQYMSQFGAAYPYGAAPYPAPIFPGYVPPPPPPVYPSPYVVQTGYEGYLVPSTPNSVSTDTASKDTSASTTNALMQPLMLLSNIVSTLMMSTLFKIAATIISAAGMIFFSGAIMNLICHYTPICDMSNRAVTYLRRRDTAERMGRMIAEGMTPERVRRASEFVRGAIRKYQQLQNLIKGEHDEE